jgi:hypothetical protein
MACKQLSITAMGEISDVLALASGPKLAKPGQSRQSCHLGFGWLLALAWVSKATGRGFGPGLSKSKFMSYFQLVSSSNISSFIIKLHYNICITLNQLLIR